jgi:hypothetical protein
MSTPTLESLRQLALERCFEFVAPCVPLVRFQGTLPIEPGAVLRDGAGRAQVLHFAPYRWLVPTPAEPLYRDLADRARILESSVNVEGLLFKRSCAAGALFDCPVVLGREGEAFDCWVMSSYAQTFLQAIGQLSGAS